MLKRSVSLLLLLTGLGLALGTRPILADSKGQSEDMYSRHRTLQDTKVVSVTYAVEVIQNGKVANVSTSYAFKKGDSVRFHVQSNTDGYMYILASGAGSGQYDVLYPESPAAQRSLRKGIDYHLPESGVKVKNSTALKSVKLVFSKRKLEIDASRSSGGKHTGLLVGTSQGSVSSEKAPNSFRDQNAETVTLSNWSRPLSVSLNLSK